LMPGVLSKHLNAQLIERRLRGFYGLGRLFTVLSE